MNKAITIIALVFLLFGCRSVKKTVDKVKTTTKEATAITTQENLETETLTTQVVKKTQESISIEADGGEVTVQEKDGVLIITGAKKIEIGGTQTETETLVEETTSQEKSKEVETKTTATSKVIKKDTEKKGIPTGAIIGGGLIAILLGGFYLYRKKPNFITSILKLFK